MKTTLNQGQFIDLFLAIRPNNFTYEGLENLFEYLEDYEESTGEEIEVDVIALCCEFTEFNNLREFNDQYQIDELKPLVDILTNDKSTEEEREEAIEQANDIIADYTTLITICNDHFIIQDY